MNDLKLELGNEPLSEGLVEELTFNEVEVISGAALYLNPNPPLPGFRVCKTTGCYWVLPSSPKPPLRW